MIARQTWAILLDSYRELNAKKLFWITMILSGLVVAAFGAVGINERGISVLAWTFDLEGFNSTIVEREDFYKMLFVNFGIQFWLAWIAMILALISTASIFPDLVQSGSIDLMLSKPISRTRLFITKYVCGLLFVLLQVGVFTVASFLVIGIRGGAWEIGLFLAIPIVTLVFSYLFSLMTLLGVISRSAIASLLLTILVWASISLVHNTETGFLFPRARAEMLMASHEGVLTDVDAKLSDLRAQRTELAAQLGVPDPAPETEADSGAAPDDPLAKLDQRIAAGETYRASVQEGLDEARDSERTWSRWHTILFTAKTALPKTAETTELLRRWLVDIANLQQAGVEEARANQEVDPGLRTLFGDSDAPETKTRRTQVTMEEVQVEVIRRVDERSVAWIIGTSLGFECVMIALAALLFWRRDF